jgi:hypothetical protein
VKPKPLFYDLPCPPWCVVDHGSDDEEESWFCEAVHVQVGVRAEAGDSAMEVYAERFAARDGYVEGPHVRLAEPGRQGMNLTASNARRLAAALLNAADTLDPPSW